MTPRRLRAPRPGYTRRKKKLTLEQLIEQQIEQQRAQLDAMRKSAEVAMQLAAAALSDVNLSADPKGGGNA